ncbi:uncharacterized protein LOC107488532 [Arachis duranensis]|uniref:Uncharacterized protein LOC107488532 n=1 Tax=Arachis duranensis TaxID=130453 RepID=A0A6P4DHP7_ARADU|nr:uncharacterized protein LOC107488532 [Arachis duranensis]
MGGSGGSGGGGGGVAVGKEDVIAKLKDDGDFDRLRLKIIRKLKDNEELRQHIASIVKQSAALNGAGAENKKPRQLSDAIYHEVGDKVMSQISDSLWQIIRSNDGMKTEIAETVQSVYDELVNPKGEEEVPVSNSKAMPTQRQQGETGSVTEKIDDDMLHENEPEEPPGFTLHNHVNNNQLDHDQRNHDQGKPQSHGQGSSAEQPEDSHVSLDPPGESDDNNNAPPGFLRPDEQNHLSDCSDEDPDVPPGFG